MKVIFSEDIRDNGDTLIWLASKEYIVTGENAESYNVIGEVANETLTVKKVDEGALFEIVA